MTTKVELSYSSESLELAMLLTSDAAGISLEPWPSRSMNAAERLSDIVDGEDKKVSLLLRRDKIGNKFSPSRLDGKVFFQSIEWFDFISTGGTISVVAVTFGAIF